MPLPGLPSAVASVFDLMPVADAAVRRAETRLGRRLPGAFLALRPPPLLLGKSAELYRGHCDELLARAAAGQDLRPGTLAEVAAALSEASLKAPLTRAGLALYESCFTELFGRLPGGDEPEREEWPGRLDEDLATARRQTAQPWRGGAT